GNVYQLAVGPTPRAEIGSQSIYYAQNVAAAGAGANVVTVTMTSAAALAEVRAIVYQGIESVNVVDVTAHNAGSGAEADSGSVTTTYKNDLLFGATWVQAATTTPDGMTPRLTTVSGTLMEDRTVTSIGSFAAKAVVAPPSPWIIQM